MFLLCLVTIPFPLRTSLVSIFFPMDEAGIKKDLGSAAGEQYKPTNTEAGIALSSENALGNWWRCALASRRGFSYSRTFFTEWPFVQGSQAEFVLISLSLLFPFSGFTHSGICLAGGGIHWGPLTNPLSVPPTLLSCLSHQTWLT